MMIRVYGYHMALPQVSLGYEPKDKKYLVTTGYGY